MLCLVWAFPRVTERDTSSILVLLIEWPRAMCVVEIELSLWLSLRGAFDESRSRHLLLSSRGILHGLAASRELKVQYSTVWFDPFKFQNGPCIHLIDKQKTLQLKWTLCGRPSFADSEQKAIISDTTVICRSLVIKQQLRTVRSHDRHNDGGTSCDPTTATVLEYWALWAEHWPARA